MQHFRRFKWHRLMMVYPKYPSRWKCVCLCRYESVSLFVRACVWACGVILTDMLAKTSWKSSPPLGGHRAGGLNLGLSTSRGEWYARLAQLSIEVRITSQESRRFQRSLECCVDRRRRRRASANSSILIWRRVLVLVKLYDMFSWENFYWSRLMR